MRNTMIRIGPASLVLTCLFGLQAEANTTIYTIPDVGTFNSVADTTLSDTFSGTGFVGIHGSSYPGPSFYHAFNLANYSYDAYYGEVEMQVDISGLSGATVTSAILSYNLTSGYGVNQQVTVTSFTANGSLAYNTVPPNNLGSTTFTSIGLSANSVDVSMLLQKALMAGQNWLGLFLASSWSPGDAAQWTFTSPYRGGGHPDSADVRLSVTTVPEPSSIMLLLMTAAVGFIRQSPIMQ